MKKTPWHILITGMLFSLMVLSMAMEAEATEKDLDAKVLNQNIQIYQEHANSGWEEKYLLMARWTDNDDYVVRTKAEELTRGITDDRSKLEVIYDWVCTSIYYDDKGASNGAGLSWTDDEWDSYAYYLNSANGAAGVLRWRRTVCSGYAELLAALLRAVGIPCKLVDGYALGASTSGVWQEECVTGDFQNHTWNEAFIDGRWVILDSTWDSGNRVENGVLVERASTRRYFDISISDLSKTHNIKRYEIREFTITYHLNGGSYPFGYHENADTYYETASYDLYPPNKPGYNFDGWYTDSNYSNKINRIEAGTIGDLMFYAKWVKNQVIMVSNTFTKIYGTSPFSLGAKAHGKLTYSSSNNKIATVNIAGKVTIKSTGKVTITIKADATNLYNVATAQVTITVKPKAMTLNSVKPSSKGKIVVKWKKDTTIAGYEITYAKNSKFTSGKGKVYISKKSKVKQSLTKLKSGKTYYVRIRSYVKIDGKKVYGAYSEIKSVTVK